MPRNALPIAYRFDSVSTYFILETKSLLARLEADSPTTGREKFSLLSEFCNLDRI